MNAPATHEAFAAAILRCPFHRLLDIALVAHDPAAATVRIGLDLRPDLLRSDDGDGLHGGVIASVIDIAAVYAAKLANGDGGATASLSVDYLRPVLGERVEAEATVVRAGRSITWVDVELFDGSKLAAIGRALLAMPRAA